MDGHADTALRLARVTGMSADFWLGLQQDWDLWHALRSDEAKEIERLKPLDLPTYRRITERVVSSRTGLRNPCPPASSR